jgi:hypothetical protein
MKKILSVLALTAIFSLVFVNNNYAQDQWTQGRGAGIYSIGIGGTDAIGVGGVYSTNVYGYRVNPVSPAGMSINASGEYKVYKFIGLGWQTGIDLFFTNYGIYGGNYVTVGIPFIAKCNVHILDAVGGVSIADKLDVYAGLNFGGGPAITPGNNTQGTNTTVGGFIQVGPTVGVRYWIIPKVAVFGEFGWGATFANAGVTF